MNKVVLSRDVEDFKKKWCNENDIITHIIKSELQNYFVAPILDVGCGMGDIAHESLYDKDVTGLDIGDFSKEKYPMSPYHQRVKIDFFDFEPKKKYRTILLSHVLQFIDNDLVKLENQIEKYKTENIIVVANKNDGFMGEILSWVNINFEESDPEVLLSQFPKNYILIKRKPFSAYIKCKNFVQLAEQISYLMVIDISNRVDETITFLEEHLKTPELRINQNIFVYERR